MQIRCNLEGKMKKILTITLTMLICLSANCATYKIKESGQVYAPNGTQIQNLYNNYTPKNYVQTNAIEKNKTDIIEIVMDFSGSMVDWVDVAKLTMQKVISQIPSKTFVGLRVFGQNTTKPATGQVKGIVATKNKKGETVYKALTGKHLSQAGGCDASQQVTPINYADATKLINGMNSVEIGGSTPMVLGLQKAIYEDFKSFSTEQKKKIILITDGIENCGGDPCAFVKNLASHRSDIIIDVILVSSTSKRLRCLTKETNGNFYSTKDFRDFSDTLVESMNAEMKNVDLINNQPIQKQGYEFIEY
ncbi:MAG: VWA domain-containing protein [Cyanobacteria bacterium SIG30]|nr:VWA domain-containing protein [Cyanobacteria bacterium SIG30]